MATGKFGAGGAAGAGDRVLRLGSGLCPPAPAGPGSGPLPAGARRARTRRPCPPAPAAPAGRPLPAGAPTRRPCPPPAPTAPALPTGGPVLPGPS